MFDAQLMFDSAATLTATGNSSNLYDAKAAKNLGVSDFNHLTYAFGAVSGTSPTFAMNLVGADDAAFSVNKITIASLAAITPVANTEGEVAIPAHTSKRYFRLEYTIGGTSPSIGFTAGLTAGRPTGIAKG